MGFFRHTHHSRTTDTIPAPTPSIRQLLHTHRLRNVSVVSTLACVGVFAVAAASTSGKNNAPLASPTKPVAHSSVQLNVDSQSTAQTSPTPDTLPSPSVSTSLQQNISTSNMSAPTTSTSLTVNGQPVDIPANGSVSKTYDNGNSQTTVQLNTSSQGESSNTATTSLNVNVSSNSSADNNSSP